jgi:hypothetical protein
MVECNPPQAGCTASGLNPANDAPNYTQPKMGTGAKTCMLFASLSSLAWVDWALIQKSWTINFYTGAAPTAVTVTDCFGLENGTGNGAIWPSIYEKAWGKWKGGNEYCHASQYDVNNWPQQCNGLQPLVNNWGIDNLSMVNPYGTIQNLCEYYPDAVTKTSGRTKYPTVAWTKSGIATGPDEMRPEHAYSVLGFLAPDYIVLRNPRKTSEGGSANNLAPDGTVFIPATTLYPYLHGNRQGAPSRAVAAIALSRANGIFGLKNAAFINYFAGYCRIV